MDKPICSNCVAEKAVLSACMLNPRVFDSVCRILTPKDFIDVRNQIVFQAMLRLSKKGSAIDTITVKAEAKAMGKLDTQDGIKTVYLLDLWDSSFSIVNWKDHVRLVREETIRRKAVKLAVWIDAHCTAEDDVAEMLNSAAKSITKLQTDNAQLVAWKTATSIASNCKSCGAIMPEGAKYCPSCGNAQ